MADQQIEGISEETWQKLYEAALAARENAYAPYSEFQVGAALLTEEGEIFGGCNVENATIGATVCAERTAIGNALTQGHSKPIALCVITSLDEPAAPCGICRQVLAEFAADMPIMMANPSGRRDFVHLDDLLPHRFGPHDLDRG